ncbi:hypothetical protein ACTA71_001272 [Dictyostelium dimigraforme]
MGRRSFNKQEQHKKKLEISQTINLPRSWDYVERFTQPFLYPFEFETLTIKQSELGDIKINATLWDTAIVMSKFFEIVIGREGLKGKRIIELGGGVGLTGIVLSKMGANITITEQKSMHGILDFNVRNNLTDLSKTKVSELWWGDDISNSEYKAPYDMIIGSDLIYEDHCIDLLLKSLLDLSSFHPKPKSKYSEIIEQIDANNGEISQELLEKLKLGDNENEDDEDNDQDNINNNNNNTTPPTTTTTTTTTTNTTTTTSTTTTVPIETSTSTETNNSTTDINKKEITESNIKEKEKEKRKKKKPIKKKKEDDEDPKGEDYLFASALLEPADTVIYLGYENRQMSAESIFLSKVHNYFEIEEIKTTDLNPGFGGVDIRILKMKKKRQTLELLLSYNKKE